MSTNRLSKNILINMGSDSMTMVDNRLVHQIIKSSRMQVQLHSISRDYGITRGHLTITSKQDDENLIISSADLI